MTVQTYFSGDSAVKIAASVEHALAGGRASGGEALPPVRALAAHLSVSPATVASAYRLLQDRGIVSGAMDGLERVLREHLRAGDRVIVEDPCFTGILDLLNALSLVPVPVPVDDDGLEPAGLREALRGTAGALIVTPRAQNPTGAAL